MNCMKSLDWQADYSACESALPAIALGHIFPSHSARSAAQGPRAAPHRPSAGERLIKAIRHSFDEIEAELEALTELRDKPAGTVRITCGDHVMHSALPPKADAAAARVP
jgi:hypothetical protein